MNVWHNMNAFLCSWSLHIMVYFVVGLPVVAAETLKNRDC